MRYSYRDSFQLYKLAVRTYVRSSPVRRFWFHFQMWGMLLLGLLIFAFSVGRGAMVEHSGLLAPLMGGLVGGGVVGPLLRPWQLRRSYNTWNAEAKHRGVYVEIDGSELRSGIEGSSEAIYQRPAICGVAEDNSTLLLFLNKRKFLYFSKLVVPKPALDEIRAWLQLPGGPSSC